MLRPYMFFSLTVFSRRGSFSPSQHAVVLPSGDSMLSLLVAATLAVQQPPPPPAQDTTKRDTTKVKLDSLPLKTARTVSFETSDGTWISLDVSPDGKTIVFELLGDLYTMPVTGGAHYLRSRVRFAAALVAGRQASGLSLRSQRR